MRTFVVGQRWTEHVVFEDVRRLDGGDVFSEAHESNQIIEADADLRVLSLAPDGTLGQLELVVRRLSVDEGEGAQLVVTPPTIVLTIDPDGELTAAEPMDRKLRELLRRIFDPSTRSREDDSWQETRPFGAEWPIEVEREPRRLAGPTCLVGLDEADIVGTRAVEGSGRPEASRPEMVRVVSDGTANHCPTMSPVPGATYESAVLTWHWEALVPLDPSLPPIEVDRRLTWSAVMICPSTPACRASFVVEHRLRIERSLP